MTWGHCHGNGEVHIIVPMMMRLHRGYKTGLKVVKQLLLCFCPQDLWCVSSGHLWISCQHLPTMYLQLESKWITAQQLKVSVLTNNCLPFTLNKLPSTADCCIQHVHVTSVSHSCSVVNMGCRRRSGRVFYVETFTAQNSEDWSETGMLNRAGHRQINWTCSSSGNYTCDLSLVQHWRWSRETEPCSWVSSTHT